MSAAVWRFGVREYGDLAAVVRAARAHVGMGQHEFADTLAISRGLLAHWERGRIVPRGTDLAAIVMLTGVPIGLVPT